MNALRLLFLALVLVSCGGTGGERPLEVIVPETTKVLDEASLEKLISVSADGTLIFSGRTPTLASLAQGDVVVIGVSSATPEGLLRKVTLVSADGDQLILETSQARLQDAIEKGRLAVSRTLTPDDVATTSLLGEGLSLQSVSTAQQGEGFVIGLNDVVLYSDENGEVTVSGSLAMKPSFDVTIAIAGFSLEELSFSFGAAEGVALQLDAKVAATITKKLPLLSIVFVPITFSIGPLPVVLTPKLTLFVGAGGVVTGNLSASVNQQASLEVGLGYKNGEWGAFETSSSSFDFDVPALEAQASAKVFAGGRLGIYLYGVVGPYAEADGYLRLDASLTNSCLNWALAAGLEAHVGVDFVADYETKVLDKNTVLAESDGCDASPALASWARSYGGALSERAHGVQTTSDGGFIVAGSSLSFIPSTTASWLVKLDAGGNAVWQKAYEGIGVIGTVQQVAGGYVVAGGRGGVSADVARVVKLDASGNVVWAKSYQSNDGRGLIAHSLQPTADGGFVVSGPLGDFGDGGDVWVMKLNGDGVVMWSNRYGGAGWDRSYAVRQTADGGFVVAGSTEKSFGNLYADYWVLRLDASGAIVWQRRYGGADTPERSDGNDWGYDVRPTQDGGFVVAGISGSFNEPGAGLDAWIVKLNATGGVVWATNYDAGSITDDAYAVAPTEDGGFVVAGSRGLYDDERDVWLFKLDAGGNVSWSRTYGGAQRDEVGGTYKYGGDLIQQTVDGGFVVAATTQSFGESDDFWLLKLTPTGGITFKAASGASSKNVTGSFKPTTAYTATATSANAVTAPLTVADISGVKVIATAAAPQQQAP